MLTTEAPPSYTIIKLEMEKPMMDEANHQRTKCGEITRDIFGSIWFTCNECNFVEFSEIHEFTAHITIHFEDIKSEGCEDDSTFAAVADPPHQHQEDSIVKPELVVIPSSPSSSSLPTAADKWMQVLDPVRVKRLKKIVDKITKEEGHPIENDDVVDSLEEHQPMPNVVQQQQPTKQRRRRRAPTKPTTAMTKMFCDYCNEFAGYRRSEVLDHMWTAHSYGFACPQCDRHFRISCNMRSHLRTHSGQRPYECKICGSRYAQSMTLKVHIRKHNNEKTCLCFECGQTFYSKSSLSAHWKRAHTATDGPPSLHYCSICGRGYGNEDKLKSHVRKVHGARTMECDICSTSFKNRSTLIQHMQLHSGGKSFECRYCGVGFAQSAGRRCHEKRQHEQTLVL